MSLKFRHVVTFLKNNNEFIVKSNYKLRELNILRVNIFRLTSVIDAMPAEWCESLALSAPIVSIKPFKLHKEIQFSFNGN